MLNKRIWTGVQDCHGAYIYYDDMVQIKDGPLVRIQMAPVYRVQEASEFYVLDNANFRNFEVKGKFKP